MLQVIVMKWHNIIYQSIQIPFPFPPKKQYRFIKSELCELLLLQIIDYLYKLCQN